MIRDVLHHLEALTHVTLYLQVHEDRADKACTQDKDVRRQLNLEAIDAIEANVGE